MRLCVLGSGSKGNCTYIEAGATRILIDSGFSGVEIQRRLASIGVEIDSLSAVLVTHEHGDHVRGVAVLSRKCKIPVFANEATYKAAGKELSKLHVRNHFETGTSFQYQDINIHPFSISHDAADPVGFIISTEEQKIGFCTDTGVVSKMMQHRLANCNTLVLESNHDPELLRMGPYPPSLQQRVRSKTGHLANADTAEALLQLMHSGLEHVVLAHISATNNSYEMARNTVLNQLQNDLAEPCCPEVSVAWQDRPGLVIELHCDGRESCNGR